MNLVCPAHYEPVSTTGTGCMSCVRETREFWKRKRARRAYALERERLKTARRKGKR